MNAKPTLGFASRTAAVAALRGEGVPTPEIARRIGIPTSTVTALVDYATRTRRLRPGEQRGRTVVIAVDVLDSLYGDAVKRGLTVNALVRRLVETVADEGMVDAVLDDAEALR